jgi:hypothetical protein
VFIENGSRVLLPKHNNTLKRKKNYRCEMVQ